MSERDIAIMAALELAMDIAYHDGGGRDLAVVAEAYQLAGYHDPVCLLSHAARVDAEERIARARKGRNQRLLHADARGMLQAFALLADSGVITWDNCSEANRQRWLARGGHDYRLGARAVSGAKENNGQ